MPQTRISLVVPSSGDARNGATTQWRAVPGDNVKAVSVSEMKWYADQRARRTRQRIADVAVLLGALLLLRLGQLVYDAVQLLKGAGTLLERAGGGLAGGLKDSARQAGETPLIGDRLRTPLEAAADAARSVAAAGVSEQQAVDRLALVLGLAIGLLPVAFLLWQWLPRRLGYAREAGAAVRLRGDTELLALRAATFSPLHLLARLGPDPVARWRRGEPGAGEALACLELSRLGLDVEPDANSDDGPQ